MKVGFGVKWGHNEIDVPVEQYLRSAKTHPFGLENKFVDKVTIYNDIPADSVNLRRFDRFVIDKCLIYNQMTEGADGTVQKIVNAQNVITKDVEHYKTPLEYLQLAEDERKNYYTVQVDDFVVYGEVDDIVTTSKEWQLFQQKYANNGFSVTAVNASIFGMNVDNVHITHA